MKTLRNQDIINLIRSATENYMKLTDVETTYRIPLVGFAHADDPMFTQLKELVSPSHALPTDIIADAKSVITFFLPFSERIINSNITGIESSREWDIAKIETTILIDKITTMLNKAFKEDGYNSSTVPASYTYNNKNLKSDWSERHIAYIAGLGTFGIHNLLITEAGCCGRMGSIITNAVFAASKKTSHENCLFKLNGTCGLCAKRCVVNSISLENGYPYVDTETCNRQIYNTDVPIYEKGVGDACGKCSCGLPCSLVNPTA